MSRPPRTVLMLTPDQGSLDRRIAQEANTLAANGWSVDIYATHMTLDPPAGLLGDNVRMLPNPHQPMASRARRFKHLLRDAAPSVHRLADAVQSRFTDRASQLADWHVQYLLQGRPYAAIFAHDIPVLPLAIRLRSRWHCPVICDLHEIYPEMATTASSDWTRSYWRRVEREFLPLADGILCVNAGVEQYVRAEFDLIAPLGVVRNTVPFQRSPRRADRDIKGIYGISDQRRVLAFAGRLEADTNIEALVLGFGESGLDDWLLAVLGAGALHDRLASLIDLHGLGDRVFVGRRVQEAELVSVLASAQAGALPYLAIDRNHLLSTPNKLFEYAQARLPIAASRLPMIEQLMVEQRNGGFVDYTSAQSTAATLRRFIEEDLPNISSEGLEHTAREICWEKDEPTLLAVFDAARTAASWR